MLSSDQRTFSIEMSDSDTEMEDPLYIDTDSDHSMTSESGRGDTAPLSDSCEPKKQKPLKVIKLSNALRLLSVWEETNQLADKMSLSETVIDRAKKMFLEIHDKKRIGQPDLVLRSKGVACLLIACRQEGIPITFQEISSASKISKPKISRMFKYIMKHLEPSVELITAETFVSKFCSKLELSQHVQRAASRIARKAVELDIVGGRSPITIAAASIFMASQASNEKRSLKKIGSTTGSAIDTMRGCYWLMLPHASKLFAEDFKFATPVKELPHPTQAQ